MRLALVSVVLVLAGPVEAAIMTIDFDDPAVSTGAHGATFLSSQGIGGIFVTRAGGVAESPVVYDEFGTPNTANTGSGRFLGGSNSTFSDRTVVFEFVDALSSFSFTRIGIGGFTSMPGTWSAVALDAQGAQTGSGVGESNGNFVYNPNGGIDPAVFTLVADANSAIASVEFQMTSNVSTFSIVPMDNLILETASVAAPANVSEPAPAALLAAALVALGIGRTYRPCPAGQSNVTGPESAW